MRVISERLKAEREALGLSQQALADQTGIALRSQQNYEKGDRSPDSEYLKAGLKLPRPALVGNSESCKRVYQGGNVAGKTAITFVPMERLGNALAAAVTPQLEAA